MNRNKKLLIISILFILATTLVLMGACLDFSKPLGDINLDNDSEIIFEKSFYAYTGEEIKPSVIVKHRDKVVDAKNYTLTYSDNVGPGKASVKAQGVGDYVGSVSATFDIGYQYLFNVNGADSVDGETLQSVLSKDLILPPTVEKTGYDFLHWTINSQPVDFDDIDNLPSSGEFVANFAVKTFTVTYQLEEGATNTNGSEYTVEDYFALNDAKLANMQFAGWYTDSEYKNRIISLEGYAQNLVIYARFVDYEEKKIEYKVPDGAKTIPPYDYYMPETNIVDLNSKYAQTKEIDGVTKKLVWYCDSDYSTRYFFREMPNENLVLYAQWEEVLRAGFLDKIDEFTSKNASIDSFEELIAYVDYICFNNVVSRLDVNNIPINVDYVKITYVTKEEDIKAEIVKALEGATYPRMASVIYLAQRGEFKIALTKDIVNGNKEASISATAEEDFLAQIDNIFANTSKGRDEDFELFPIDFVEKTFEVETSNQLFYVLSHGYRPLPKKGSKAESIYNQFRSIMRQICDDSMSDVEKARAIYEWIIINVQYDDAVAKPDTSTQIGQLAADKDSTYLFDAFYLEGVLRGSAVCDGISKAYSVMCAIEGIDCVRVTGERTDGGHAWNKIRLSGEWYLSDATWGNSKMSSGGIDKEFIAYNYFLFTDRDRYDDGYRGQNYTYYVADTEFDEKGYYSSRQVEVGNYKADFYIDSDEELSYLLDYIDRNFVASQISGLSFEVIVNPNVIIKGVPVTGKKDDYNNINFVKNTVSALLSSANSLLLKRRLPNQPKVDVGTYMPYYVDGDYSYIRAMFTFR